MKSFTQRCWEWIETQEDFSSTDLVVIMGGTPKQVKSVMDTFVRRKNVKVKNNKRLPKVYEKTEVVPSFSRQRQMPVKKNNGRQKMWSAIRWFDSGFSINDVASVTNEPDINIYRYLSALVAYEYVVILRGQWTARKQSKPNKLIFKLVKNTGHLYPIIRTGKRKALFDQNLNKEIVQGKGNG
jgi:hypothetical protein